MKTMKLSAMLMILLVLTLPFSSAQVFDFEEREKEAEVGEAIIVNVDKYEPSILPSSLVEDGDVPVTVHLTGVTAARLLKVGSSFEPFYGQALVKQVYVRPLDEATRNAVRGMPKYEPPEQYSVENLGYLVIMLKQIEKEDEVPDEVKLEMKAEITFENVERLYSLIEQDIVLPEQPDEDAWRSSSTLDDSSFFSRRGFIRASKIEDTSSTFTVYASSDMVWPYTGSPRPIGSFSLDRGETSDYYRLSEMQGFMTNAFRVRLDSIVDPMQKRARLRINVGGAEQERIVTVGSQAYPGSKWTVTSIGISEDGGVKTEKVYLKGPSETKIIQRATSESGKQEKEDDPCASDSMLLALGESDKKKDVEEKIQSAGLDILYCTAASEYKKIISDYSDIKSDNDVLYSSMANFRLGRIYERLGRPQMALSYYNRAIADNLGSFVPEARSAIDRLQKDAELNARYENVEIEEFSKNVRIQLMNVIGIDEANRPTATINIEGIGTSVRTYGDYIFPSSLKDGDYEYNWRISGMSSDSITLEKHYLDSRPENVKSETESLDIGKREVIGGKSVIVNDINLKKFALVSVIPGSGIPMESESNFTIHIPIEKRLIQWTPNEISSKINSTRAIISDLDGIISKLDSVVTMWKKVCMATFAWLTIKNSFLGGLARTQARRHAMNGLDGNSGWNRYCQDNSGEGRLYDSYEDCIVDNAGNIETTIDSSQEVIEQVNEDMEDYKEKGWYLELSENDKLAKYQQFMGEELYDANTLKDYRYWQLMKESEAYSSLQGEQLSKKGYEYDFSGQVDKNLEAFNFNNEKKLQAFNMTVKDIEQHYGDFDSMEEQEKTQLFSDLYNSHKSSPNIASEDYKLLGGMVKAIGSVRKDYKKNSFYAYTSGGKKELETATLRDYLNALQSKEKELKGQTGAEEALENIRAEIEKVKSQSNQFAPLTTNQGQVYKSGNELYVPQSIGYSIGETRSTYHEKATAEVYPDGKPYCIPTKDGNYVKVLDFYKEGSPNTIQEWNVGKDGFLCTADDVLIKHQSVLEQPEFEREHTNLRSIVSRFTNLKEGSSISSGGKSFAVSASRSQVAQAKQQPNCYDTMDPSDCMLLFGVCDPVMCPPSRFNLGGSWQVNDVVQTGIIGSSVLGLHNFNIPYEPVPICLTGILAGLQNIKSVLEGYVECLNTALVKGQSVGICDKIRSVFICELIWREAIAILNIKGGLLTKIMESILGQDDGGGEYLTFRSSLQNVADSVNFFTKSYANTAFAAYESRSFDEIGTTICKQAIFGKFPGVGKFFDEIAQPESPAQYTALVTETEFSEALKKSHYQVFYHIYAGEDKEAVYSVYLMDSSGSRSNFYVTDRCEGTRGQIEAGGISSETIDCTAPSGYDKVCITINGQTNCGFGKVTTNFAIEYVNDLIVEDEAVRNIDSEEDCYPSYPQTSPSLLSLPLPGEIDMLTTGIQRVCSLQNPGQGTNPNDWKIVGTCGKDSTGRSLGQCWLDLRTVSIKDTETMSSVMEELDKQGLEEKKEGLGITGLLGEEESKEELAKLNSMKKEECDEIFGAIPSYKLLEGATVLPKVGAESSLMIGRLVEDSVKCSSVASKEEILKNEEEKFRKALKRVYYDYSELYRKAPEKSGGNALEQRRKELKTEYQSALRELNEEFNTKEFPAAKAEYGIGGEEYEAFTEDMLKIYQSYLGKDLEIMSSTEQEIDEKQVVISSLKCGKCGEGLNNVCDIEECHAQGECYFSPYFILGGECEPIASASKCSDFSKDAEACAKSSLGCEYTAGECLPKPKKIDCQEIADYASGYIGMPYGNAGKCRPGDFGCETQCGSFVSSVYQYYAEDNNLRLRVPTGIYGKLKCEGEMMHDVDKIVDLRPGDLFVATSPQNPEQGHTGIYVGRGRLAREGLPGFREGCAPSFEEDPDGDYLFIHSVGPVCYTTLTYLRETRNITKFCRHESCMSAGEF